MCRGQHESTFGSTTPISESTLESTLGALLEISGSVAGQQTRKLSAPPIARTPAERAFFMVSDRHPIAIADFGLSDR